MQEDVKQILNRVEASSINDIGTILNTSTERFSQNNMTVVDYKNILINIAKRSNKLAQVIYAKDTQDSKTRKVDIEEYRTLLDISRECRDGLRQLVLLKGHKNEKRR